MKSQLASTSTQTPSGLRQGLPVDGPCGTRRSEWRRVVLIDCFPGGVGVVVDFDGLGVEVVADQDAGEQVLDVAGRGRLLVRAADEGAGWVGDVVEAFGDGGGCGADP